MINQPYDHRLLHYLQHHLDEEPISVQQMYRSTRFCGSKVLRLPNMPEGVFVLSNGQDSRLFGINSCKNAWYCPACAAKVMSKYAANIDCLIQAMEAQGQWAFMLTLTVLHTSGMSCDETTEILYQSWKDFIVHGNHTHEQSFYSKKDGKRVMLGKKSKDVFAAFCEEFNCKHRVRVGEYTYGNHGWHPHFHTLFFVDKAKFKELNKYQDIFNERWQEIVKKNTLKMWNKLYPGKEKENKVRYEIMESSAAYDRTYTDKRVSAFMSIDEKGNVRRMLSSQYICGWGADKEVTGNVKNKAAAKGHLTPYQILEKAANENSDRMWELYLQYMYAVKSKRHRRINFSKGAAAIIAQWKNTQGYKEVLKKKHMRDERDKWELVCWFDKQQWSRIYQINLSTPIISNILFLATLRNKELIAYYLNLYDIKLHEETPYREYVEKLYNDELSDTYQSETQEEAA